VGETAELGRTFPQALGDGRVRCFYLILTSPSIDDELTLDFAKTLIENEIAAIHGSAWKYDTYVPIFFAANGVSAQTISRPVGPQDIV
jgi:hypothetical protein